MSDATGQILWRYEDSDAPFFSSPAVNDNVVVFGGRDSKLHCLNKNTGKAIWHFQAKGEIDSSPVLCGDKTIVGCEDGRLYMVDLADGKLIWSYQIGQPITSSPADRAGQVLYPPRGCCSGGGM